MNHQQSSLLLPKPFGALLARLPAYPGSVLLVAALNAGVARQLPPDVGERLLHKRLRIHVRDACMTFDFTWNGHGFAARVPQDSADLCISASAHDFVRLAQRQEDPDTLFFSRRLSMEGDTELGLVVKNTLDALELPVLDLAQLAPRQLLARLAALRAARSVDSRAPRPGAPS
ncbi:MAG: sterol-binding protein [Burkholderiaceae bacterium]|nr:MAG: sterol-binding protein [Burkholderiaceae bacterium]